MQNQGNAAPVTQSTILRCAWISHHLMTPREAVIGDGTGGELFCSTACATSAAEAILAVVGLRIAPPAGPAVVGIDPADLPLPGDRR